MLRRFSDAALGSFEKLLNNINGVREKKSDKRRKLGGNELIDLDNDNNKNGSNGFKLRKSKGQWNLQYSPHSYSHLTESVNSFDISSDEDDELVIDLTQISSSEIPSEISINEADYWDDDEIGDNEDCVDYFGNENVTATDEIEYIKGMQRVERRNSKILSKDGILKNHPDLSFTMRAKLISWIYEVGFNFRLQRETIHSTQTLLDSYLSLSPANIPRTNLQLIGLACLLISAKLEEIRPPNLSNLRMICDELYTKREIAVMELEICAKLKWNLVSMNLLTWTRHYLYGHGYHGRDSYREIQNGRDGHYFNRENIMDHLNLNTNRHNYTNYTTPHFIENFLDYLIHFPGFLNFKPSKLSLAIIQFINGNYETDENLELEMGWLKKYHNNIPIAQQIIFCDPKLIEKLSDEEFEISIKKHRKTLSLILKQIKLEEMSNV